MKLDYLSDVVATAFVVCLALTAVAQERSDYEVIRNFVGTRDKVVTRPVKSKSQTQLQFARPIGLGCTLFKRGPRDTALRISAAQEFREGDAVRFMIESNIRGYLYVFHTENDGPPKMLFPDARLQGGNNFIRAHVPKEVPSSREEDPEFRWFHFNQTVAIERFYLLVTRERLEEVLTGEKLVTHCRDNPENCPWCPSIAQWKQLLTNANTIARESQSRKLGQAQTPVERDRITRDVGLPPGAPSPAKVKMNISSHAGVLLMNVDLIHK
ncbi:MAG TPA: DUF4384 domain-containing protein [Blastocatellia bacterium]|nr:DUF4384 domain-containing protein [Blastocatellia bacterium]